MNIEEHEPHHPKVDPTLDQVLLGCNSESYEHDLIPSIYKVLKSRGALG